MDPYPSRGRCCHDLRSQRSEFGQRRRPCAYESADRHCRQPRGVERAARHFEVADPAGTAIDPLPWLQARGVTIATEASPPPTATPPDVSVLARGQVRDRRH